jgi:hypothetical protein
MKHVNCTTQDAVAQGMGCSADRPSWSTAPLELLYGTNSGWAINELIDAMFTIDPREPVQRTDRERH